MRCSRSIGLSLLVVLLAAAACHAPDRSGAAPGSPVVGFDDVTDGIAADRYAGEQPAAEPEASARIGAYFADGEAGDVRGRVANRFADTDDDGLPDARAPRTERMLVYEGQVRVEVPRAEEAAAAFLALVEGFGGYLQMQTGTALTVRLPAERFEDAFAAAREAGRVLAEQRSANDVTEEFVDLGIRLDNARKARERLLEVLGRTEKVEDVLAVERELRRLTEEIERMEGRRKFLRDQVAMATLRVDFRSAVEAPPRPKRRRPSRFPWINRVGPDAVLEGF